MERIKLFYYKKSSGIITDKNFIYREIRHQEIQAVPIVLSRNIDNTRAPLMITKQKDFKYEKPFYLPYAFFTASCFLL
jgi:hypothetical protein